MLIFRSPHPNMNSFCDLFFFDFLQPPHPASTSVQRPRIYIMSNSQSHCLLIYFQHEKLDPQHAPPLDQTLLLIPMRHHSTSTRTWLILQLRNKMKKMKRTTRNMTTTKRMRMWRYRKEM